MIITKAVFVMMVSLIFSILLGLVLIPFLKKLKLGIDKRTTIVYYSQAVCEIRGDKHL